MRRALAALAALALGGCGRNAYFEVDVVLPQNTSGADRFAVIAFAPGDQDFDALWAGNQTLAGVKLSASGSTTQHASVEGNSEHLDSPVEIKVTFCKNASCSAQGDDSAPETRLRVERAFYEGQRTSFTWTIACIPSSDAASPCAEVNKAVREVKKCEVAGCREGTSANYCVGDKHFCE